MKIHKMYDFYQSLAKTTGLLIYILSLKAFRRVQRENQECLCPINERLSREILARAEASARHL